MFGLIHEYVNTETGFRTRLRFFHDSYKYHVNPQDETRDHPDGETATSLSSNLEGTTALITGASSGIGETIAERFAAAGAAVVICSREQQNVDPVAERITESGGKALAIECDVTDREAVGPSSPRLLKNLALWIR